MEDMKRQNLNIYNENRDAQVITPNPSTTATAVSGNVDLPLVDSYFIQNYLGPNGTSNTMVDDIYNGLLNTQKVNIILFRYLIKLKRLLIQRISQ